MKFFLNGENIKNLEGFIFCDSDFLSVLSFDSNILREAIKLFPSKLVLDPFVKLEFLRAVYLPEQRQIKEDIISLAFILAENNQETWKKNMEDALIFSRIYAHQNRTGASIVDLFLASRIKNTLSKSYLATGNAKDFPSFIFDTIAVLNFEQKDGTMRAISVLEFNKEKYSSAKEKYSLIC